ncbi:MAG: hypothetical protein RBR91_08550 [Porticoccaceae bacterium]|nr:hypothetical protein [Porticoccaceae bacterium]
MDIIDPSHDPSGQWLDRCLKTGKPVVARWAHHRYYLDGAPPVELIAVCVPGTGPSPRHQFVVSDRCEDVEAWLRGRVPDGGNLAELGERVGAPVLALNGPWRLAPVAIAKPWGREIWYTGIEQRGQSRVTDGRHGIPLPWALALAPPQLLADGMREPALLKILDPLAEEVFGDLYFELHEEKREVYVVTHVDRGAWPDGRGAIRFGFDQTLRRGYPSDEAFRQAFREAVARYETVRRAIDGICDLRRMEAGIAANTPVDAATLKGWLATVPSRLLAEEHEARTAMNRFTQMLPLQVGDVVKVPCLTPHALQHGVRTVEFQTPVYERKILSFAQKVLTQDHWDTAQACQLMSLDAGHLEALLLLEEGADHRLEQVVVFSDFEVRRLRLRPGARWDLHPGDHYCILMVVAGTPRLGQLSCQPEDALLLPRTAGPLAIEAPAAGDPPVILICLPRQPGN